jgi:hypothetical protein
MAEEQNNVITNSSNKNIWLAIALAVITSLTSLGTALISSKGVESKSNNDNSEVLLVKEKLVRLEELVKNVKEKEEKLEKDIDSLNKLFNLIDKKVISDSKELSLLKKKIREIDWSVGNKVASIVDTLDERLETIGEIVIKNERRSIVCYSSLTPEEVSRGLAIINIINGDGSTKSINSTSSSSQKSKIAIEFISHLDRDLIVKTRASKKD